MVLRNGFKPLKMGLLAIFVPTMLLSGCVVTDSGYDHHPAYCRKVVVKKNVCTSWNHHHNRCSRWKTKKQVRWHC